MNPRRTLVALTLAAAPLAPLPARAEVVWICTLGSDGVRLVCVADADPARPPAAPSGATARVRGTSFPLDPARPWIVDLWSPPTDWEQVQLLAQATICYRTPDCTALALPPSPSARR